MLVVSVLRVMIPILVIQHLDKYVQMDFAIVLQQRQTL